MLFGWVLFSLLIGAIGNNRNIGFWGAFFLSLILSPLIGLIFTIISKSHTQMLLEKQNRDKMRESLGESFKPAPQPKLINGTKVIFYVLILILLVGIFAVLKNKYFNV